jgi:hypothetical protein
MQQKVGFYGHSRGLQATAATAGFFALEQAMPTSHVAAVGSVEAAPEATSKNCPQEAGGGGRVEERAKANGGYDVQDMRTTRSRSICAARGNQWV